MSETSDTPANDSTQNPFDFDRSKGNFSFPERHKFDAGYGLTEATIDYISDVKDEPDWIRHFRKNALAVFESKPMPTHWASPEIEKIDFSQIRYYLSDGERPKRSWEDVPEDVKRTFERLGVPEQERQFLAGVEAQYDSESAYSNMKEELRSQGVIFVNSTEGLKNHEEIFRQWFGKVIPTGDNKFLCPEQRGILWRFLHLRAQGRKTQAPSSGILSHQLGKLRPVRTYPHHRGRRRGAHVYGRLHGAPV